VRLGLVLEAAAGAGELEALVGQALEAEAAGLALGWLPALDDAALLAAAALGARTSTLRLAACVRVGEHPLAIAEAATVADNCSNGRIVLVLEAATDGDALGETADAVVAALAPRPFRHEGARWRIPANLTPNEQHEDRIVLRPPVVQTELPVWLTGPGAAEQARRRGLGHVASAGSAPATEWAATEARLGLAATRVPRPAVFDVETSAEGGFDDDALVSALRVEQRAWGLDTAILRLPAGLRQAARAQAIHALAAHVAPRVVMHELPAGIEAHWRAALP
jgi:alkanesulfonate monooxygenase SsuD/methylene tetrahydromethanopterin reductase-like flavin-dependent oxidoreductase (luciferase family)